MSPTIIISSVVIISLLLLSLYYLKYNKKETQSDTIDTRSLQEKYEAAKDKKPKFSKEEKVELSWQFLYDITEYILSKFSPADQEEVKQIGLKLASLGVQYQHIVELPIQHQDKIKNMESHGSNSIKL